MEGIPIDLDLGINPNAVETNDDPEFNDLTECDKIIREANIDNDIFKIYKLADPKANIFSPQIEVFAPASSSVDASRSNMSAKQIQQIVTSPNCDIPFWLNKNYRSLTDINSPFVEFAKEDGFIVCSEHEFLIVYYPKTETFLPIHIPKFKKLVNNTISLRYQIGASDDKTKFKKGDMLYDYTGQVTGSHIPRIGYRAKVGFIQLFGYTADDGFVMSQSFANKARIEYSRKVYIPITKEIIYHKNDKGNYFYQVGEKTPKSMNYYIRVDDSDSFLREVANTSDKKSKLFGKIIESEPGGKVMKIKVHKLNKDKTYDELESEYIYTRGLIEEVVDIYKNHSVIKTDLYKALINTLPKDQAIEYTKRLFEQYESTSKLPSEIMLDLSRDFNIEPSNIDIVLEFEILASTNTTKGDKFANMYAGKGVCSLIVPDHLMPGGLDIAFNALGAFGRNNWGTMFELGISKIIRDIEDKVSKNKREETCDRIEFIAEKLIKRFDMQYYNDLLNLTNDIRSNDNVWTAFKADYVKHNGLYLFADTFIETPFKTFIDEVIKPYETEFNVDITGKTKITYSKEFLKWMRDRGFISSVFEKDSYQDVDQFAYVGEAYWVKLYHTSLSKFNSLGLSNQYSIQTGDPSRGAKNNGGQHMSWQTSAALIGHKSKIAIIKEYWAVKSSAVNDKHNFISKMVKDGEYIMKETYFSPTTTTLNCYLAMIFMRYQGYEPAYIDKTISQLETGERILSEEDEIMIMESLEEIENDIDENPLKYMNYELNDKLGSDEFSSAEDIEEDEDDSNDILNIEDLFDAGCLEEIEEDENGRLELEDDL